MAACRYVQTGGKCVHNLVFILAQICTILHIWTSIDNYAFLDRSFQHILGWITWLIHWLTERIFLRSINKQEYSQQQVSSYWSDAFTSFFFSLARNCLRLIFLFTVFFSPWDWPNSLVTRVLVSPMQVLVITFCQCLGFFFLWLHRLFQIVKCLDFFLLLHRLFQMSVGRSPILFWRRRKTWDSVRPEKIENVEFLETIGQSGL